MTILSIAEQIRERIEMLGVKVDNTALLNFSVRKSATQAADFCNFDNIENLPKNAELYVVEYVVSSYLLENADFKPLYEKLRQGAEIGLLRFRRIWW